MKLINLILEQEKILVPRRSKEERQKNYMIATQKKIQQYIKDGSKGDLDLSNTPIQSLPDNLTVRGNLYLYNTLIQSLPDNLNVEGSLDLEDCKELKSLPDNLTVGGYLDLRGTPIQSLPDNLNVEGSLDLDGTSIQSLPDSLAVGGSLWLQRTPISKKYSTEEIRKMVPKVEGGIII